MPGEVVFNTGMVGYPEALTDPSYRGQILVLTYPLVGNYGVPSFEEKDAFGLPTYFESGDVQIAGLVVSSYSEDPSHWASTKSLGEWLEKAGVPALFGVDTRMLTKRLRERGSELGRLEVDGAPGGGPSGFSNPNLRHLVGEVSTKAITRYGAGKGPKIVAIDCGMKYNIIRYLVEEHGVELIVVPHDYDLESNPSQLEWDGVFCSNGPGDPSKCVRAGVKIAARSCLSWMSETSRHPPPRELEVKGPWDSSSRELRAPESAELQRAPSSRERRAPESSELQRAPSSRERRAPESSELQRAPRSRTSSRDGHPRESSLA